jgi:phosphatidylethanolamine-binding protein (PEBP) family uncharacterized protein
VPLRSRLTRWTAGAVLLSALLAACGPDDGRNLAEPNPDLTAVPVPTTTPVPVIDTDAPLQGVGPGGLTLSSADFSPGGTLPVASACGGDRSPALEWTAPPRRVTGLALVVQDIDADGVAQWVVTDISPGVDRAPQGEPPRGSEVRLNSAGVAAWSGPCPRDGTTHRIVFTLYALDKPVPVTAGDAASVVTAIQGASFGSASLLGRAGPAVTGDG